jgi:hypothetical protein
LAAAGDADRDSFTHEARERTAEWHRKLQALNDKAEANGKAASHEAEDDLNRAWTKVEAASRKLETAGAESWEEAKTTYERASHDLADAWHRHHPEDK